MDQLAAFDAAMAEFDRRVRLVGDRWDDPTPCARWSVRDLVGHVTSEQLWVPWLLRGATLDEVGDRYDGDVLGDAPIAAWAAAAEGSSGAFHEPGALTGHVHTSGGPTSAVEYGWQLIFDLTVHAWDLARGAGLDDRLDGELVGTVHHTVEHWLAAWRGTILDYPVEVADTAGAQEEFIAATGRNPRG